MDRDDLIERAARVLAEARGRSWDGPTDLPDDPYVRDARALADAGMLTDPETVARMGGTILAVEVALTKHGLYTDKTPLPEKIETLAAAYRDVWRWWEKAIAERDALAQTVQQIKALADTVLDERGEP